MRVLAVLLSISAAGAFLSPSAPSAPQLISRNAQRPEAKGLVLRGGIQTLRAHDQLQSRVSAAEEWGTEGLKARRRRAILVQGFAVLGLGFETGGLATPASAAATRRSVLRVGTINTLA